MNEFDDRLKELGRYKISLGKLHAALISTLKILIEKQIISEREGVEILEMTKAD